MAGSYAASGCIPGLFYSTPLAIAEERLFITLYNLKSKHEVLGRTNRPLSFYKTRAAQ
jgi:hypothetical protein